MTTAMLGALLLSFLALCISIFALVVVRRTSGPSLQRRQSELSITLESMAETIEGLKSRLRDMTLRLNTQAQRARSLHAQRINEAPVSSGSVPSLRQPIPGVESGSQDIERRREEDRARMNALLATGAP